MATNLGQAYVQIIPSAKGISGSISKILNPEVSSAGKSAGGSLLKSMLGVSGGIGITKALSRATKALTDNLGRAVDRYDAIENSKNVFKAMKFNTQEVDKVTQYFQETLDGLPTGFDEAIKGTQSFAGATKNLEWSGATWNALNNAVLAFGGTSEQTQRVTDQLTKSFSSGTIDGNTFRSMISNGLGPALQEMAARAGYNNLDSLQKAFTDGALSAEDFGVMLQDVSENGSASLESLESMARANTMGIGTAFSLVSSRITQGLEAVLRSIETTLAKIGLPSIAEMVDSFSKGIREAIKGIGTGVEALGDFVNEHKEVFVSAWETMGSVVDTFKGLFSGNLSEASLSFSDFLDGILSKTPDLLTGVGDAISGVANAILDGLPGIIENISTIVSEIIGTLLKNGPAFMQAGADTVVKIAKGIWERIPSVVESMTEAVAQGLETLLKHLPEFTKKGWEIIGKLAKGIWDNLPEVIATIGNLVANIITKIGSYLPKFIAKGLEVAGHLGLGLIRAIPGLVAKIPQILSAILNAFGKILGSIFTVGVNTLKSYGNGITSLVSWVVGKISGLTDSIKNKFSVLKDGMKNIGSNLVKGLWNGINSVKNWILRKIKGFTSSITSGIKGFFGIHSPSTVWQKEIGKYLPLGLVKGVDENLGPVEKVMDKMEGLIMRDFSNSYSIKGLGLSRSSQGELAYSGPIHISIGEMNVREKSDIEKIAQELAILIKRDGRGFA